jgi:hypothetical protein
MAAIEDTYDTLLDSTALDHDPWSRANLHTYRRRHMTMVAALDR